MPSGPTSELVSRSLSPPYVCCSDKTSPIQMCPLNFTFYTVVTLSETKVMLVQGMYVIKESKAAVHGTTGKILK